MSKKKIFSFILAGAMAISILGGCGSSSAASSATASAAGSTAASAAGSTAASAASSTASGSTGAKTNIQMWYHISETQAKVLLEKIDDFMKENPDISVTTQSVAFADLKKQISMGAAADSLPDVSLCDTVDNASFAAMGAAVDVTDEIKKWGELDQYYDGPKSSIEYDGKYYGVPYYSNCLAIMYNKDIFDKMGISYPTNDWTWDDFKKDVAATSNSDHYGLTMSMIKSEEGTFNLIPFIWQAGADYDSLDSAGAKEAMTMINDFYQNGYMSKELISMTQADMCSSLFATGKSAMMVAGSWLTANIKKENADLNYGVVTFPTYKNSASPIGGGNIVMLKDTNKEASWKLMEYLSSEQNNQAFCEAAGYISPRKDAVEASTVWKNDPIQSVYAEQMTSAKARGPHPQWPSISSAIQEAEQSILAGEATVSDAFDAAAAKIKEIK